MIPEQSRAAREILGLTQESLAEMADLSESTIDGFEQGTRYIPEGVVASIQVVLETAGIEFIAENGGGPGVRPRKAPQAATIPVEDLRAENDE